MKDKILKEHYRELGLKGSKKRWDGHIPMSKEEKKEYNNKKQKEYRAKKKHD